MKISEETSKRAVEASLVLLSALALWALAWWIRSPSFHQSVIDHDESTYIVIGEAIARGERLYTDVWDTKPLGIFLIFGATLKTLGGSVYMIRSLATLMVALSAWWLCLAKRRWGHRWGESLISGTLCVFICSAQPFGLPAHIELFFIPFVAAALWILSGQDPPSLRRSLGAGLLLGLGFIVKYIALFDAFALSMCCLGAPLYQAWRANAPLRAHLTNIVGLSVAFVLPFALSHLFFAFQGNFQDFYEATYVIPRRYVNAGSDAARWRLLEGFHQHYLYLGLALYGSMLIGAGRWLWRRSGGFELTLAVIWYASVWFSILTPGKPFTHYLLQLALPVAFFAPRALSLIPHRITRTLVMSLAFIALLSEADHRSRSYERTFQRRPDVPREASAFLKPLLKPHDIIYTANFDHILYHLLNRRSPTKYVHRSLLTNPSHLRTLALDPQREIAHILSQRPRFILTVGRYRHRALNEALRRDYRRIKTLRRRHFIYERRD